MKRIIEWVEKTRDGVKRMVRVDFFGRKLRWQQKIGESAWEYDFTPSASDWEMLEADVLRRYQRRRASLDDLQLVQRSMREAAVDGLAD